jgi:para-aminobenzoate synthetase/4-amino-4-deoxychorismate lyase
MNLVFDFADYTGHVARRVFANPRSVLTAHHPAELNAILAEVDSATRQGYHAAGFIAYEAAPAFDRAAIVKEPRQGRLPLAQFGIFDAPRPDPPAMASPGEPQCTPWQLDITPETYHERIRQIHAAIERGDTYQINYTLRAHARLIGSSGLAYYERLRRAQRADYCAWLDLGHTQILSVSPELFFSRKESVVTTRPMKGTIRRGMAPEEDAALAQWLRESRKNRAENLMIVDLLRNDLSRLADPGGVSVPSLFTIERYPTLLQMTSTVEARLKAGVTLRDILAALFPCGSITGAPKLKSMEIIAALEDSPRGPYCGTVGWIRPGGEALFNVAIRTVVLDTASGEMECGLGGGITWDSRADEEYEEVLTKSRFLSFAPTDFELIETFLLEAGDFWLREYHLRRLTRSAAELGFPDPPERLGLLLDSYANQFAMGRYRVRLTYSRTGSAHLEGFPIEDNPEVLAPIALAASPVDSADPFLRHKTTRREVYEQHAATVASGFYDVLLWNERGELTEFTRGNLVLQLEGHRFTPALASGLLAGTFRQALLDQHQVTERILTFDDLAKAEALWFINGVRGWVAVQLRPETLDRARREYQERNR